MKGKKESARVSACDSCQFIVDVCSGDEPLYIPTAWMNKRWNTSEGCERDLASKLL